MNVRRRLALIAAFVALGSCTAKPPALPRATPSHPASSSLSRTLAARVRVPGGCGQTALYRGGLPAWTATAVPPPYLPYAVSLGGDVVAILFGHPFHAGHPMDPDNKILWIMRFPRNGQPLRIAARPGRGKGPTVRSSWSANSSPGEIYPSIVDVPTPGCWRFTLTWGTHSDQIDVSYGPARET